MEDSLQFFINTAQMLPGNCRDNVTKDLHCFDEELEECELVEDSHRTSPRYQKEDELVEDSLVEDSHRTYPRYQKGADSTVKW